MVTDNDVLPLERPRSFHFEWVLPTFYRPRRILEQAVDTSRGTWITPLLILTILAMVAVLIAGPLRQAASANGAGELPQDFQYWSPDQQSQYMQSRTTSSGPLFTYGLPAVGSLIKVWLGWLILAAVLHLGLTLGGSRGSMTFALNLAGWAMLPTALRYLIQIISMLATHQMISTTGLSGFAPEGVNFLARYVGAMLPFIDIYLFWTVALILIGARQLAGMTAGKAWAAVLISVVLVILLEALPGFIGAQLGTLSTGGNRFFFF